MTIPAQQQPTNDDAWTVRRILDWTVQHFREKGCENPRLDAEILLAHVRNSPRIQLYVQYDSVVTDGQRARMRELVKRRANFEPVAYLVGKREFYGLDFTVTPDVLIPRPDTETLVMEVVNFLKDRPASRVLELGVGSGCISVATAVNAPHVELTAVDVSREALAIARQNAVQHGVQERMTLLPGDLFEPISPESAFDAIVSNPPYVTRKELADLQSDVRDHEPRLALDGGEDGLDVARRILDSAHRYLKPDGLLLLELSPENINEAKSILEQTRRFDRIRIIRDGGNRQRLLAARIVVSH